MHGRHKMVLMHLIRSYCFLWIHLLKRIKQSIKLVLKPGGLLTELQREEWKSKGEENLDEW